MDKLEIMFKGYIPTYKNGKVPTEEVKNRVKFYDLDEVKDCDSFGGVLDNDVIMVDIDNEEQADILHDILTDLNVNCNIMRTKRGKHFYFLNTNIIKECTNKTACVGITNMDVKLGTHNRICPIKINGDYREIIQSVESLDPIPLWLKPIKAKVDFQHLSEGDGRNQTLFNYILTLQQAGLTKDQIRETVRLINRYILKDSISEKEIDVILRDDSFLKQTFYNETGKLQYEKLASYIRDEYNIVKINAQLHVYSEGVYVRNTDVIEKVMLKYINNSTKSIRGEVLRWLELICEEKEPEHERYILFKNGIYDLYEKKLLPLDPKRIFQNKIDWNYNPKARSEVVDGVLDKVSCNDGSIRSLIEEMTGYCMYRRSSLGKFFILTGEGKNGKSTILKIITTLIGEDNISSVSMKNLTKRFNAFQLAGKLANIGDDISGSYIEESEDLKKLTTGERLDVEEKGKNVYPIKSFAKLIFSANEIPKVKDSSYGFRRRMLIIPFKATFSKYDSDYDPHIEDKLATPEAMEYLLQLGLDSLHRIIEGKDFTESKAVDEELYEYNKMNNPIIEFLEDYDVLDKSTKEVYKKYTVWCAENSYNEVSSNRFVRQVKTLAEVDTKQIRLPKSALRHYIFVKEGED